jgi:hypothetical protein
MPPLEELARFRPIGDPWFTADAETVYWVSYLAQDPGPTGAGPTVIEANALRLGEPTPRALMHNEPRANLSLLGSLWSSGADLVWADYTPVKPPNPSAAVHRLAKSGESASTLVEGLDVSSALASGGLRVLGADDQRVYLSPLSPVGISTIALAGGPRRTLVATDVAPTLLARDGEQLYWTAGDSLWRARTDGSAARLVASELPGPVALAVHGGIAWVVYGPSQERLLARVATSGPSVSCAAASPWPEGGRAAQLVADDSGAYVALAGTSDPGEGVWWFRPDGRGVQRLIAREGARQVRLLRLLPGHLLVALSDGEDWRLARVAKP